MTDPQGIAYQQGNPVTLIAAFADGSTPTDPTTVTFHVRAPDDTHQTYVYGTDPEVTRLSAGRYQLAYGVPTQVYQYHWDAIGDGSLVAAIPGDFYVIPSSVDPIAPTGPQLPPCTTWINGDDLDCPDVADPQTLDAVASMASMLMYELSGRQFGGICGPVTVRPCRTACSAGLQGWGNWQWSWNYWSGDWGYGWFWGNENGGRLCSCGYDSTVELAGYPITEIVQVKIDGQVLPPIFGGGAPQYRLDEWRYLTRLSDPDATDFPLHWPACQRLDLQDDQPGTWAVTYKYGVAPPPLGIQAARQIGCELLASMTGGECKLPSRVTKVVRQGLTTERVTPIALMFRTGATGLIFVDAFLAAYNSSGLRRRASIWSPDTPFPVRVGAE